MAKVCSKAANWIFVLMLVVPATVLATEDPPSIENQARMVGRPVAAIPVPPALRQALASSLSEATSIGAKAIPTPPTGTWGIVSEGSGGGGIFRDSDSEAEAWLGSNGYGVQGYGSTAGGYFEDSDGSAQANVASGDIGISAQGAYAGGYFVDSDGSAQAHVAWGVFGISADGTYAGGYFADSDDTAETAVAVGNRGIEALGSEMGGYFKDTDHLGYAYVGYGDRGIHAYGTAAGGYFKDDDSSGYSWAGKGDYGIEAGGNSAGGRFMDSDSSGYAYVGYGDRGIEAFGYEMGGYFEDSDSTGYAYVGKGDYGIQAYGNEMGGYFKNGASSGYANVGYGNYGIQAYGDYVGGYFEDSDETGNAYVGSGDRGIDARGSEMGGSFKDSDDLGYAWVGYGDRGIQAYGNAAGGYFKDDDSSGYAWAGKGDLGIEAGGDSAGGYFNDLDSSSYAYVGDSTSKIFGSGSVSFVQNHPYDPSSVIVYAAPEGDEIATYTRGTAKLVDGEATVPLGETFKWVTNPDIGLTVHLTPVADPCVLYVVDQATDQITVRGDGGYDCTFHYLVYGLRIGFEESSILQEKEQESYIPSMADHRQLYERRPDLKTYNSLERFKGMQHAVNPKTEIDLSRAQALRNAIVEFDPAVHELPRPPGFEEMHMDDHVLDEGQTGEAQTHERVRPARADHDKRPAPGHSGLGAAVPLSDEGNVYSSRELANLVDVSEEVQPGDVLVVDPDRRGLMRRGSSAADNRVVGIVAAWPGGVHGSDAEIGETKAPEQPDQNPSSQLKAPVAFSGVVNCKVDASYGAVWTGDLLVTSPTPGHAMAQQVPLPGTVLGKALEPLEKGTGTIKVLVMLR